MKRRLFIEIFAAALLCVSIFSYVRTFGWSAPSQSPPLEPGTIITKTDIDPSNIFCTVNCPITRILTGIGATESNINNRLSLDLTNGQVTNQPGVLTVVGKGTSTLSPTQSSNSFYIAGHYLYVVLNDTNLSNVFRIVDVTNPKNPTIVGGSQYDQTGYPNTCPPSPVLTGCPGVSVFVAGRYAYLIFKTSNVGSQFRIVDISNVHQPVVVGGSGLITNMPAKPPSTIFVAGNYAYMTFQDTSTPTNTNGLRIIDVSDPTAPQVVAGQALSLPKEARSIFVHGTPGGLTYAYLTFRAGNTGNTFRIINVSSPLSPSPVSGVDLPESSGSQQNSVPLYVSEYNNRRLAYIGLQNGVGNTNFVIIDVSTPSSPGILFQNTTGNQVIPLINVNAITASGRYVYLGFGETTIDANKIRVLDVTNPAIPTVVAGSSLIVTSTGPDLTQSAPTSVFLAGKYLYLTFIDASLSNFLRVIDITGIESGASAVGGALTSGSLQVDSNFYTGGSMTVNGALNAGAASLFNGAVSVLNNLAVHGNIYASGVKAFRIRHPLDPERSTLSHAAVESPEAKTIYDGEVMLDSEGKAIIQLPDYFEALNQDFRYQIKPIDGRPAPNLYIAAEVKNNQFAIAGGQPFQKIDWQVTGIRHDPVVQAYALPVESEKAVPGYLNPELFTKQ